METTVMKIDGMTCMGCVKSVQKVLAGIAGVQSVEVSLEQAQATVAYDPARAKPSEFKRAVEDAGYEAA
ncbi:MAG TPA: heavy-metal-associated domain-containing protein [Burkholderiales bacterium]|nr:heavy-metal-associated domain-containing protein [Burkholderiales bacterium]